MRLSRILHVAIAGMMLTSVALPAVSHARPEEEVMDVAPDEDLPPSKNMKKAEKFFRRGKKALKRGDIEGAKAQFESATIYYQKVLTGNEDSLKNKQKAQYHLAIALFKMGYLSAAKNYFAQIVEAGDKHAYYLATLKWLVSLQLKLPESAGILPLFAQYKEDYFDTLDNTFKAQIFFFLGRYYFMQYQSSFAVAAAQEGEGGKEEKASEGMGLSTDLEKALAIFAKVPKVKNAEEYYIRAKIFEGVILMKLNKPVKALKRFRAVLEFAAKNPQIPGIEKYVEFTTMALARVYYQAGVVALNKYKATRQLKFAKLAEKYLTLSIQFYENIPQRSPYWVSSLFEESWAYFLLDAELRRVFRKDYGGFQKALGNIHTLNAPFFEDYFFPETLILRSVIYVVNCRPQSALESLMEFRKKYDRLQEKIRDIAIKYPDDDEAYFAYVMGILNGEIKTDPEVRRLVRFQFVDRTFKRELAYLIQLRRERKLLEASSPTWQDSNIGKDVRETVESELLTMKGNIGALARSRMKILDDKLTNLTTQADDIEIEINNLRLKKVSAKSMESRTIKVKVLDVTVDDEHVLWPFTGEYWQDELGYYRFVVYSACGGK